MDEKTGIIAILAILVIIAVCGYFSNTTVGNVTYAYDLPDCARGQVPVYEMETRFGTGKMMVVSCVEPDTVVVSNSGMFPRVGQRWKIAPGNTAYTYS